MADALEVVIRAALTTAARQITPGNGYYTSLGDHILDAPLPDDMIDETLYPAGYFAPGVEAPRDGCNGGVYGSAFEFWFYALMRAPVAQAVDELSRMKADMKKSVLTDSSLGLGAVINDIEWGGSHRAVDVVDRKGFGRTALLFVVSADWSPSAA